MSLPPQGGWQPPHEPGQSNQGQPYGGPSGYGGPPPPHGWQQGPWPPVPPPRKGGGLKWLLIAVAVLLIVGISVGATLLLTRDGGGGGTAQTSPPANDFASANDTGPVSVITDEPTCPVFNNINNGIAQVQTNGWDKQRGSLGPEQSWTSDQRAQMQSVALALSNAADQSVLLSKQTPHRVVRELYQQFIAYSRAYAASIGTYTPPDDSLASVSVSAAGALIAVCNAITYGSVSPAIALPPGEVAQRAARVDADDPRHPGRFLAQQESACSAWIARDTQFDAATAEWANSDTAVNASEWTPAQRATQLSALTVISGWANAMDSAGKSTDNLILADFAQSAALYARAYVTSGDTYVKSDSFLSTAAFRFDNIISEACKSVAK